MVHEDKLWNRILDWTEKNTGKSLLQDRKGTLEALLQDLAVLMSKIETILEKDFYSLELERIEEGGLDVLVIPSKLVPLLGDAYVLQSEMRDDINSVIKEEICSDEEEEEKDAYTSDEAPSNMEEDDEGVFTCAKCYSVFESYEDLLSHPQSCPSQAKASKRKCLPRRSKGSIEQRTCQICSRTFSNRHYLQNVHAKKCDASVKDLGLELKCSKCNKVYSTSTYYYLHIKTCGFPEASLERGATRSLVDVICRKCGFMANSKEEFQDHACRPVKLFKCLKCDFQTHASASLRYHDVSIHQRHKALFVCEVCGATYPHKYGIRRHLRTHSHRKSCSQCEKTFSDLRSLNRHVDNLHKPSQKHPCEVCGKTFNTLIYLKRHVRSQHPENGELEKHECSHCHSFFREKSYLKKHIRKKHSNV